jgi:NAD(P)-dependent dehydrogenase (short-subunit alcohol dehydrogenase family)
MGMTSYVVTGGGRGVGRAIVERLVRDHSNAVVGIDIDPTAFAWTDSHPASSRIGTVIGDATEAATNERAADVAESIGVLSGWVNNAAIFRDAELESPQDVLELIRQNLAPAVVGSATAVRRFLAAGTAGAIVNVSSHQAQRPVRGALPYATAKAAIEGFTRALAVDSGPRGIRANAVALGSISTDRYEAYLAGQDAAVAAEIREQMAQLHPLGRVGEPAEAADAVAYLLSDDASFINGAIVPVDGGRSVLGRDPEEAGG